MKHCSPHFVLLSIVITIAIRTKVVSSKRPKTSAPSAYPSSAPSSFPTVSPTYYPTAEPSPIPTMTPTTSPSNAPSDAPTVLDCPCFESAEEIDVALDARVEELNKNQNQYRYYPTCKSNGSNYFDAALGRQDIRGGDDVYSPFASLLKTVNGYYNCSFSATHKSVENLTPGQIEECKAIILATKACSPDENE